MARQGRDDQKLLARLGSASVKLLFKMEKLAKRPLPGSMIGTICRQRPSWRDRTRACRNAGSTARKFSPRQLDSGRRRYRRADCPDVPATSARHPKGPAPEPRRDRPFHAFHRKKAAFFFKSLPLVAGGLDKTPIFLAKDKQQRSKRSSSFSAPKTFRKILGWINP